MNEQNRKFDKNKIKCRLCRALVILVMVSPVLFYYGHPLFGYYTSIHGSSLKSPRWQPLGVSTGADGEVPPCTSYLVDVGASEPIMAFSSCPESERRKLETERIDPATYQLRKAEAVSSGERGPSGAKGKPDFKLPGNENVPPEVLEQAGSPVEDER